MECQQRYSARIVGAEETESSGVETAVHELRMEMTLHRETNDAIPGSGAYPVDGRFSGGHWQVTDFNRVLNGNFPIPLPLFNRESFDSGTYKTPSASGGSRQQSATKIADWPTHDEGSNSNKR
ncbi:hypothetical protein Pmar_PMAR020988 [Perkinsus marinus ATCC 50983]|uniref:Uncharacterized protein n=1 Tax=Perkinsus marinus (strain ATCC 50983 / TXsc) TaxID=423536 RepID=C5K8Y0_PERM5|nr:hypothetical protein Pmar_PMAR020988 [Perkinsus marinus ATCC 50983]EER19063.1 hypothetical protein Pmar_PMAR020988 [Perkinsus marinus ATCC 50983]|eukprot:XP_002787267.1 hypothetical protein Pmar_PMAR020988 [Perkinsus marinus ATCC 50983]